MADKDFTSLLGKSSGTTFGELAGAYLSGGRKKDNRARNILLASLFFNAKEASMQSKVKKNLQELEDQKTLELAKLNQQWQKRTELENTYNSIQKNGALEHYRTDLEKEFNNVHAANKDLMNLSSGDVANYKIEWLQKEADKKKAAFDEVYSGVAKGITTKEEFSKPYMDYYKGQKEKIMNPSNVSLVHNLFGKIGIGNKEKELNDRVEKLETIRNINQERILGFTQAEIKQLKKSKTDEATLFGLQINDADLNALMSNTSLGDAGLDAGRLRQEVRAEWRSNNKTYQAAIDAIAGIEEGFNSRQNLANLNAAESKYKTINPEPNQKEKPDEHSQWLMGLNKVKRDSLGLKDITEDAIYRANQLYNIAANNNLTEKTKKEFIEDVLAEDIRKATGEINLNQVKGEIIKGRMYTVYGRIDDGLANTDIKNTELSPEKITQLPAEVAMAYKQFDNLNEFNGKNSLSDAQLQSLRLLQQQQYVQNQFDLANLFAKDITKLLGQKPF